MIKEVPIMEIGVLLEASKNRLYKQSIYKSFKVLATFLQANKLTTRELLSEDISMPSDDFCLYESDLTTEGVQFVDEVVPRWFTWIEKGNPVDNVAILEKGLKKLQAR